MGKKLGLKGALVCAGAFIAAVFLTACGGKTLYLYNWTYYTPDSVIEKFEAEFDVKVVYDDYPTNEDMYTKLRGGASGYDIVIPSQDYVSIMKKQDMLERIDHSKIPNLKYLRPEVLEKADYDPEMAYSVPYYWGAAGIAVNKTKLQNYEKSWNIFSMDGIQGRACMLDDMREVIGDALSFLGYSVNSTDRAQLNEALAVVNGWKTNLAKFDADMYGKSFAEGEFWIVQGYPECIFSEYPAARREEVDFFIPEAGGPMYIDSMCIPKGAKNIDLAHEFINFILRPEIYAEFLDTFGFPSTIHTEAGAYKKTPPLYSPEMLENCELKKDLGVNLELYNEIWQQIRFGE